jgi:hypothetical protein
MSTYKPRASGEEPADYVCISKAEFTVLTRDLKFYSDKLARFWQMCKTQKTPLKMQPIICCAGTFMHFWSKWLDVWLQKLKPFIPSSLKNGDQRLDEASILDISSWALLVVTNANSMYNNIDTNHVITVTTWWLKNLQSRGLLPPGFPLEAVISAHGNYYEE